MQFHILLVEDDTQLLAALDELLQQAGYHVTCASNGEAALTCLAQVPIDVVISDIRLGAIDGVQVLRAARQYTPPPVVILLTGYASLDTCMEALRADAYDYLLKPIDPDDFLERVTRAVQRRKAELRQVRATTMIAHYLSHLQEPLPLVEDDNGNGLNSHDDEAEEDEEMLLVNVVNGVSLGTLRIDYDSHQAFLRGQPLRLTPTEFTLLACLATEPGRVWGYREIVRQTHNHYATNSNARNLLRVHIHNLRQKIGTDCIVGVRGIGYKLVPPA